VIAGCFIVLFEEVAVETRERIAGWDVSLRGRQQLEFCDGLDQVLVNGYEIRAIFLIDQHVGEADKETLLFVDRIGHTIPHGRNEKFANIDAVHSPDADANLLAFWHGSSLPRLG
jgi:hypothetical protein